MPKKPGSPKDDQRATTSLRDEVKEALRAVLRDVGASAAAKASAGRTLLEFYDDAENSPGRGRRSSEMTVEELDAEIARLTSQRN